MFFKLENNESKTKMILINNYIMKNKFIIIYFCLLFIILSLANSKLLHIFWVDFWFYVKWTYEFTKSLFFSIFSSIFIISYFLIFFKEKIIIPKIIYAILGLFWISLFTSEFPITNIFWSDIKWHSILLFTNLIWLFIILINQKKEIKTKILKYTVYLSIIPLYIAIKEYYYPSFNYWDIANRAFWTFGHPNSLALYLLMLLPILLNKIRNNIVLVIFILFTYTIFLTKSVIWITFYLAYTLWILSRHNEIKRKQIIFYSGLLITWVAFLIYNFWIITKLNSFVSRFFIWETTIKIIFSNIKYIIFWIWNDSLQYLFDAFKSPYLYIFENYSFTADRTHNIILKIFLTYWLLWLSIFSYIVYIFFRKCKNNAYFHAIILFLLYNLLNFSSIIHYFVLIILISIIYKKNKNKWNQFFLKIFFILISTISIISSIIYYREEYKAYLHKNYKSNIDIYNNLKKEDIEKTILKSSKTYIEICENLTNKISSAENYIFCWNLFWKIDKNVSLNYYKKWLEIIPDMRDINSIYFNNFFVKNLYNENRFFSEKFNNLEEVLKRLEIKMN